MPLDQRSLVIAAGAVAIVLLIALVLWRDWRRHARLSPTERERRAWDLEAYRRERPRLKAEQRAREERIRDVAEGVRRGRRGW